jgi:hypothetical protein
MPSRTWVLVIVVFWLVMVGWLYQRDLWPRLRSDEPALFQFDLSEEARIEMTDRRPRVPLGQPYHDDQRKTQSRPVHWSMTRNGVQIQDYAETRVVYQQKDHTLVLVGDFKQFAPDQPKGGDPILQIETTYHVDWGGNLLDLAADVWLRTPPAVLRAKIAEMDSTIQDNQLISKWLIRTPQGDETSTQQPIRLSKRGNAMCLTQPFTRITGLIVGQRWQVPLLDLLSVARTRQPAPWVVLQAVVSEDFLTRPYRQAQLPCFVVTCSKADQPYVRLWVRQTDGLVLRQEVYFPDETLLFDRDQ